MPSFKRGDHVTLTNPQQPTNHKVGDTGVALDTGLVDGIEVVQMQNDSDLSVQCVYPREITKS